MAPFLPVAVSCGDPAGIGAEIALKACATLAGELSFFWIGDPGHLPAGAAHAMIFEPSEAQAVPAGVLPVLAHRFPAPARPGHPDRANAAAVVEVIARAVGLVRDGHASAMCTLPISKIALHSGAGFGFPGHTEYLAHLAGVDRVVMLLASPVLKVVPATIHIPLAEVPSALRPDGLEAVIRILARAMVTDFGIAHPRIRVAGLNPHAGEGGALGHEEISWIAPLVSRLAGEGLAVSGPHPADTMFHAAARAGYDVAVAMYHDQALIPIKTLDFDGGVNVTLGLPFVRTSPDHGTAFDIAGKGVASEGSLVAALRLAAEMATRRAGRLDGSKASEEPLGGSETDRPLVAGDNGDN